MDPALEAALIKASAGASLIIAHPDEVGLQLRARVGGQMRTSGEVHGASQHLLDQLKRAAGLDPGPQSLPQMGLLYLRCGVFELHTTPANDKSPERAALVRLDDAPRPPPPLGELGLCPRDEAAVRAALARPGLLLCSGPQHSGMNTLCYSALMEQDRDHLHVATVEVAPRAPLPKVNQFVQEQKLGLGASQLLRMLMRADVDVLYARELIDRETTELSLRLALRGALILSTVHTRSAAATPVRLDDMEIPPWLVAEALSLVTGQRLLRALCDACKRAQQAPQTPQTLRDQLEVHHAPVGCDQCALGYEGWALAAEIMPISSAISAAILARAPEAELVALAREEGMRPLREAAMALVRSGRTSLQEALMVCGS